MLENITVWMLKKWRDAVEKHCYYGKDYFCDGIPTVRGGKKRRLCRYYDERNKKCTQPEIAECKKNIKYYLEGEKRK